MAPTAQTAHPYAQLVALSLLCALAGAFAQHAGSIWLPLIPACAWLPLSLHLLRRRKHALAIAQAAHHALHADRAMDRFRTTRRDPLTHLPNRQCFTETLATLLAHGRQFALFVIDLDNFDHFNANLGDAAGDELLAGFARRLQECAPPDHAARLDGDSFALLLSHPDDVENLQAAAGRLMNKLRRPHATGGQLIELATSAGAAIAREHGTTAETLLRAARLTLLTAKQKGPGTWHVCGRDLAEMVLSRQTVRRDMLRAIEAGQIVPYYQPIVRLPSGEIAGFEVLARWNHPELGLLLPEKFIPVADELALAGQISMALIRQVAEQTRDWPAWCRFAINISAGQVRELICLLNAQPGDWQRRLDFSRLDVEIAECALMRDRALVRELIDTLHEHEARAVLDDFGSGSANFFYLQEMPFDSIKIGKGFVQNDDARAEACITAMLALGRALDVSIVADGVETETVACRVSLLGCHFAQGFFYAYPMPASAAAQLLGLPIEHATAE